MPHVPALIRLLARHEPLLLPQNFWAPIAIELIGAKIAVAEERRGAALEMIARELLPLRALFQCLLQTRRSNIVLRFVLGPYHHTGPMIAQASAREALI